MNCLNCNIETNNPKYCSKSCSAKHTNKLYPKRKPTKKCKTCGKLTSRSLYCSKECKPKGKIDGLLKDVIYTLHHKSSAFAYIRENARRIGKKAGFSSCQKCGYSKHYEVCHIKSISSFPLDTPVSQINHIKNLIPLCPNCHWEHDHGI